MSLKLLVEVCSIVCVCVCVGVLGSWY